MANVKKKAIRSTSKSTWNAQDDTSRQISLIITTKNETRTISELLESIANQTRIPDEIIISDASEINSKLQIPNFKRLHIRLIHIDSSANRSVGRNTAIANAKHEHILITDAGCKLKDDWVEQMMKGFSQKQLKERDPSLFAQDDKILVVAGFYEGTFATIFEQCEIPYALVMPDKLDTKNFLPATRSMGITKTAWKKLGGFNENYRYAEDYDFAKRIQSSKMRIAVVPEAIVYWRPRKNLFSFAKMISEHAYGDAYAGNWRPKVGLIYVRYGIFLALFLLSLSTIFGLFFFVQIVFAYISFSIVKNYRYVRHWKAMLYLPVLQVVSDIAVMWGALLGFLSKK